MTDADQCGEGEDDHKVFVSVEYDIAESEEGKIEASAAVTRTHLHNVPPEVAAGTLMLVAHKILSDHMAHSTFEDVPNHGLAHAMAHAAAIAYLVEGVKNLPMDTGAFAIEVPDDISALLEGEQ